MDFEMKMDVKLNMPAWISPKIQRISCSHNLGTPWCLFPYVLKTK